MKYNNLGGYKSINKFVEHKLKAFRAAEHNFQSLYKLMFSERDNVIFERNDGYKIIKTTYGQCFDQTERKAATLKALLHDVPQGGRVGVYMNNSVEWIEIFWAVLRCGYNPLLMNMRLDDDTLNTTLSLYDVKAVVSEGKTFPVKTIASADVVAADEQLSEECFGTEIYVMSSGTSSHVKVCAYTAEQFYWQIIDSYNIIKKCRAVKKHYNGELKLLTFLPFYHIFGLVAVYIWFAFFSRTFVQLNDFGAQTIVNTIRKHKVTHIFAVPLFWEKVYEQAIKTIKDRGEKTYSKFRKALKIANLPIVGGVFGKLALGEVRENLFGNSISFMITGGSMISRPVMEFFNGIGYRLADGYGMTEIGITSVELSGRKKYLNGCSVGKPMSSTEYRVNEKGQLLVRGKAGAAYVLEEGVRKETDSWFNTHDIAEFKNGRYYILGRCDDLIVSASGENLNPNLVEPKLEIADVKGVCIVRERDNRPPVLLASVSKFISAEKAAETENAIKEKIAQLNLSAQIGKVVLVAEPLIKENEFKVNRRRLEEDYLAGRLQVFSAETVSEEANSELIQKIKQYFATALGKQASEIGYTSDFFLDEGGTSLDYFSMTAQIQQEFDVAFPATSEKSMNSVKDICAFIEEQLS